MLAIRPDSAQNNSQVSCPFVCLPLLSLTHTGPQRQKLWIHLKKQMAWFAFSSFQTNLTGFEYASQNTDSFGIDSHPSGFKYACLLCECKWFVQSSYDSYWKPVQFFCCLHLRDKCAIQTATVWATRSRLLAVPMEITHKACLGQLKCLIYAVWRHVSHESSAFWIIHHMLERVVTLA